MKIKSIKLIIKVFIKVREKVIVKFSVIIGEIKGITRLHVVPKETEEVAREIKKVERQFEQQYNIGKPHAKSNNDEELDIFNSNKGSFWINY